MFGFYGCDSERVWVYPFRDPGCITASSSFCVGGVSIVLLVFPCIVFSSLGFFWVFEYLHLGLVFVQ